MKAIFLVSVLFFSFHAQAQSVRSFDPAAPILPANTLRFYINFDRSARGLVHQRDIKLLDSKNVPIENAFMNFGQELWSPNGKRLTVMFDPGKVKRGVEATHSELAPLKEGETYTVNLGKFQHAFQAGPAVREKINPTSWVIGAVKASSRTINIKFDRVMDTALLEDQLEVQDEDGRPIPGIMRVIDGGSGVSFTSFRSFKKGNYQVQISPIFEDVAGNRTGNALDHSVSEKSDDSSVAIIKIVVR